MKVAFCLSGQPRFFEKGYTFFKKNLFDVNPDCEFITMIHGWFDRSQIGKPYDASSWNTGRSDYLQPHTEEKLVELYRPAKMRLEKQIEFTPPRDYSSFMAKTPPHILFSLAYSHMQSIEFKRSYETEHQMTFDWVVRGRFDWALLTPIILKDYDSNVMNIPGDIPGRDMNDQFAFSSSKNMDHYGQLYHNIDRIWLRGDTRLSGESLLGTHLLDGLFSIGRQPIDYAIIRGVAMQAREITA